MKRTVVGIPVPPPWVNKRYEQLHEYRELHPPVAASERNEERNKRRFTLGKATRYMVAGLIAIIIVTMGSCVGSREEKPVQTVQYTVRNQDTLWEIAARHANERVDIRDVYQQIIEDNKLSYDGVIRPGQRLLIPRYERE